MATTEEPAAGSTVPRRQLGRYLRQLREGADKTIKTAAEDLEWSPVKIWRIESGQTSMRALDVEAMCKVYGATQDVTDAMTSLAKETKAKGWWYSYDDAIPEWFELYVGLESAASRLRHYEPELIPGLLQTPAYAAEVFRVHRPEMSDAQINRGVAVRLGRQAVLTRKLPAPPRLDVVLHESVLHRPFGTPRQMVEQLSKINDVGSLLNVSVKVLPTSAGIHRGAVTGGSFIILDFSANGRAGEPSVVYSDGLTGALYLDKAPEVAAHDAVWVSMWKVSLSESESRKLITSMARKVRS
ncbi:MAG TPA: helix-turn-helix transcriptional regulator [Pseudonocardiaceae bacterium]|nr:helix-turn-helix transcriptional regulator [Pseudonocardiaceae bacterium]